MYYSEQFLDDTGRATLKPTGTEQPKAFNHLLVVADACCRSTEIGLAFGGMRPASLLSEMKQVPCFIAWLFLTASGYQHQPTAPGSPQAPLAHPAGRTR